MGEDAQPAAKDAAVKRAVPVRDLSALPTAGAAGPQRRERWVPRCPPPPVTDSCLHLRASALPPPAPEPTCLSV